MEFEGLPGAALIEEGLRDLARGQETVGSLLVLIGAPRLRAGRIEVADVTVADPDHRLYQLLAAEDPDSAHARYNALVRQLISFERALECAA